MDIRVAFDGLDTSDALHEHLLEKLERHEPLFEGATHVDATFKQQKHARGVKNDYIVILMAHFARKTIRVEKKSADLYSAIDEASDVFLRRVRKFKEKKRFWLRLPFWKQKS